MGHFKFVGQLAFERVDHWSQQRDIVGIEGLPYEVQLLATHVWRRKEQPARSFASAVCLGLGNWLHHSSIFRCRRAAWCHVDRPSFHPHLQAGETAWKRSADDIVRTPKMNIKREL